MPRKTSPNLNPLQRQMPAGLPRVLAAHLKRIGPWIDKIWTNTDDDSELRTLDDKIRFLADRLVPCWHLLHGADASASISQQRINLKAFEQRGDFSKDAVEALDPATQAAITSRYKGGWKAYETNFQVNLLKRAVRAAIRSRGAPRRGRSGLSDSLGRKQLALFLAAAYATATGKRPARIYRPEKPRSECQSSVSVLGEVGAFHDFCQHLVKVLPSYFFPKRKGANPGIDDLVRLAVSEYTLAQEDIRKSALTTDHRLWNIPEHHWLGPAKGN